MEPLTKIGDLTSLYGISSRTLRYYEQEGLIKSVRTPGSTYRVYDEDSVRRLEQILILRKMQIPIKDIILIFQKEDSSAAVEAFAKKLKSIDLEIENLHLLREVIDAFLTLLKEQGFRKADSLPLLYEETMVRLGKSTKSAKGSDQVELITKIDETINSLSDARIVRIPEMLVVSSTHEGCSPDGDERMLNFVNWAKDHHISCKPGMRQGFMFFNPEKNGYELIIALPERPVDTGIYETKTFQGGLFAVTAAYMHEIQDKYNQLVSWIANHDYFELDTYNNEFRQHPMGEILTPDDVGQQFHFEQQDIYIPIRVKMLKLSL